MQGNSLKLFKVFDNYNRKVIPRNFCFSYSVFVSMVAETTLTPVDQSGLSWRDISSICRVNEKVAKVCAFSSEKLFYLNTFRK